MSYSVDEAKIRVQQYADECFLVLNIPPIPVGWMYANVKRKWGHFRYGINTETGELLQQEIMINVKMMERLKKWDKVRSTTLHEVAHYYQYFKLGYTDHGDKFWEMYQWLERNIK